MSIKNLAEIACGEQCANERNILGQDRTDPKGMIAEEDREYRLMDVWQQFASESSIVSTRGERHGKWGTQETLDP